jgi:hypothetical protein
LIVVFGNSTPQQILVSDVWRILVELNTSHQQLLIRIPIYDAVIQKMIDSCIAK